MFVSHGLLPEKRSFRCRNNPCWPSRFHRNHRRARSLIWPFPAGKWKTIMDRPRLVLIGVLVCAACTPDAPTPSSEAGTASESPANAGNADGPAGPAAGRDAAAPEPEVDPRSPEAARLVLERYAALLGESRFAEARRLWSDDGRASGMDDQAFASAFGRYAAFRAEIGPPGRMEGAAGSSYVEIPLRLAAVRDDGTSISTAGTATLRRVNDVPGSSREQRQWRIYRLDLQPPL